MVASLAFYKNIDIFSRVKTLVNASLPKACKYENIFYFLCIKNMHLE